MLNILLFSIVALTGLALAAPARGSSSENPFPPYTPEISIAMSKTSTHYYTEHPQADECRKIKDPKKYGDKGSVFKVNAPDVWRCALYESTDCSNPEMTVSTSWPGIQSWEQSWVYSSYKCYMATG